MPKSENISAAIAVSHPSHDWREKIGLFTSADKIAIVHHSEFRWNAKTSGPIVKQKSPLTHLLSSGENKIEELTIVAGKGTPNQLDHILEVLEDELADQPRLLLCGFRVTAHQFHRLLSLFQSLVFENCDFRGNWWLPRSSPICQSLEFLHCTGTIPTRTKLGALSYPSLYCFWIRNSRVRFSEKSPKLSFDQRFSESILQCFWSSDLEFMMVSLPEVEFLCQMPAFEGLKSLDVDRVNPELFGWMTKHDKLEDLTLSWIQGAQLPWSELSKLKRLRSLSVEGSPLIDSELKVIASVCRLHRVVAYYTKLTPQSWPVILSWPTLRRFWGSEELRGKVPDDLPEKTSLREFVAFNARAEWFRSHLSRYPDVKVVEM
jgi:hypothetical protein